MKIKRYSQQAIVPVLLSLPLPLVAGNIDSSTPPDSTNSYTIGEVCDRLDTGAAGTLTAFTEPTAGPGSTGCTTTEVMNKAPAKDNTSGAAPSDVASGKTYWGLVDDNWGLQTGTASAGGTGSTPPNPYFTDNGDGTVTDNFTKLIWLKNANCFGVKDWYTAISDANSLSSGSCGLTDGSSAGDWRLPNRVELTSLVDFKYSSPALSNAAGTAQWTEGDAFSSVQTNDYWSSTTYAGSTAYAWYVYLGNGNVYTNVKSFTCYVWPVRGGQ